MKVIMKLYLIICALICLSGCVVNDAEAIKALDDNGFGNIVIVERGAIFSSFNGCGRDDGVYYIASASNPSGKQVRMLVCCGGIGSFKGCVVRSK